MSEIAQKTTETSAEETRLHEAFGRWLKTTGETVEEWIFDGENYVVYVAGGEPEIYEPALVRELVGFQESV